MEFARCDKRLSAFIAALVGLMVTVPFARADPIFSFSDSPSPTSLIGGDKDSDDSSITVTGHSKSGQDAGYSSTGINENIMTVNLKGGDDQSSFSNTLKFPLKITDTASGSSHTVNFSGMLSGNLGEGGTSVMLTGITPTTPLSFDLGGYQYTVTLINPSILTTGDNQINVNIQGTPLPIPEPGSLFLFGGFGAVGVWYSRRKLHRKVAM
jgi:hypothetical protein